MIGLLLAVISVVFGAEISVWHAYRGQEEAGLKAACNAWAEANGHTVSVVAVPFGAFDSKLETAIPRGNGPDLFIAAHGSLGKWSSMGIVTPIDDDLATHLPATAEAVRWRGQTYGVPLAFKSVVLLYDPKKITTPPKTAEALIRQAREHTGDGSFGLVYQASEPYFHGGWMHAFGARGIDTDGTVRLDTKEHVAAYAFTQKLAVDSGIMPSQPTGEVVTRLYEEGKAAFVISGPWFVADLINPIAAAPLPSIDGSPGTPYLTVDAAFLSVPHDPAAADLQRFLGDEGAQIRYDIGKQAVSRIGVTYDDPITQALAAQAKNAVPISSDPRVQSVFEAQARALRRLLRGAVTPEQAAAEAQQTYKALDRPPPEPAAVWPYLLILVSGLGLGLAWILAPFREAEARQTLWDHRWDYLWVAPAGVALSLLVVVPFVTGALVSLFAHDAGNWTFVGIRHFVDILLARDWPLTSPLSFVFTLVVTVAWTVSNLVLHVAIGVALALVLREPWVRLRGVWRALLIIPWAVPNYITALIWKGMFHAQYGAINALIGVAILADGPVQIDWFSSFATSFAANLTTNTWLGFPFMMVVTLGALQAIPRDLEEAAEVDGASWWFRFRHVVWPLLAPALMPAVILGSVWTFNMFNVIYLVSGGEPDSSTEILISEAYRWAFSRGNRYGYASAYAVLIFGVLLLYSKGANKLAGRKVL